MSKQTAVVCRLFGHDYKLLRKISATIQEVKCGRCKQEFGMNDNVQALLPLDDELQECHNTLLEQQSKTNTKEVSNDTKI